MPRLSGPVLRGTARLSQRYPPIARYAVFGVLTWPIGCDTPSTFSEHFPLEEHAKWRCDTPPRKGVSQRCLRDTLWKPGKWVRYPPLRYYLERVLRDRGGISHWDTKCLAIVQKYGGIDKTSRRWLARLRFAAMDNPRVIVIQLAHSSFWALFFPPSGGQERNSCGLVLHGLLKTDYSWLKLTNWLKLTKLLKIGKCRIETG